MCQIARSWVGAWIRETAFNNHHARTHRRTDGRTNRQNGQTDKTKKRHKREINEREGKYGSSKTDKTAGQKAKIEANF